MKTLDGFEIGIVQTVIESQFPPGVDSAAEFQAWFDRTTGQNIYDRWTDPSKPYHLQITEVLRRLHDSKLERFLDALKAKVEENGDKESVAKITVIQERLAKSVGEAAYRGGMDESHRHGKGAHTHHRRGKPSQHRGDRSINRAASKDSHRGFDETISSAEESVGSPPINQAKASESVVECHFQAEIDKEILPASQSTLTVTVSRERVEAMPAMASKQGSSPVRKDLELIVEVFARRNLRIVGASRVSMSVPDPGAPQIVFFNVSPSEPGEAEAMIIVRQDVFPLARLDLKVMVVNQFTDAKTTINAHVVNSTNAGELSPMNQLRIFDSEDRGSLRFLYELCLPGVAIQRFESDPIMGSQRDYVEKLYREIEEKYVGSSKKEAEFRILLKAMGGRLFSELLPAALQKLLWTNRDRIEAIQVISTEPFVPWELVFLKNPDERGQPKDGRFLAELGLTRWIHGDWHPQQIRIRPGRARYVAPEYQTTADQLPEAQAEVAFLEQRLSATPARATLQEVYELLENGCDLLHFVCHGAGDHNNISNAALELSARTGEGNWETDQLKALVVEEIARLKDHDGNQTMVVLNACQSGREGFQITSVGGFAQAFLKSGAGMFVGTLWSVVDKPARIFIEALYQALIEGKTLSEAAKTARSASSQAEPSSWLAYAVYGHPQGRLQLN
jgi:CHAT domain